nr:enoyl-CoA hydratase/isomerase family protein [Leucobacter chinensis]
MRGSDTQFSETRDWAVHVDVDEGLGVVRIDRVAKRNSLTPELCDALTDAVRALDADPLVRVIALTGEGADFSAGADITRLDDVLFDERGASEEAPAGLDHLSRLDAAIGSCEKPTVALVKGVCMGGGWQLASACDIVICSDDARIAITPALLGLVYPRTGVERLVRLVGESRAKHLLFSADRVSPVDAERWGLVTLLVPSEAFEVEAYAYLERLVSRSAYAIRRTKALIDLGVRDAQAAEVAWRSEWAVVARNPDLAEGRAAFVEGRKPNFTWPEAASR